MTHTFTYKDLTNRIKFLPGDLLWNDTDHTYSMVISTQSKTGDDISYLLADNTHFYLGDNDQFSNLRRIETGLGLVRAGRLLNPNYNYICSHSMCKPKMLMGGCWGCNKFDNPRSDKIYFPGDEVYVLKLKQTRIIVQVNLSIRVTDFLPIFNFVSLDKYCPVSNTIFTRYNQYLREKYNITNDIPYGWVDMHAIWDDLRDFNKPEVKYLLNSGESVWSDGIRLRSRSRLVFIPDNAKEICDMCIYQGTEECIDCITNSLIQQR